MKRMIACLLFASLTPALAIADGATETIASPSCKKPVQRNVVRKADDPGEYDEQIDQYKNCIQAYVDEQTKLSKQHIDAANTAIADLNTFISKVNEQRQKVGG